MEKGVEKHKFYAGLARPSMTLGVPSGYFGGLLLSAAMLFIWTKLLIIFLLPIPFWLIGYLICINDSGLLGVIWVRVTVIPLINKNKAFWGSRSYMP
jgi:type IV secretory pathway VirB3-like protein